MRAAESRTAAPSPPLRRPMPAHAYSWSRSPSHLGSSTFSIAVNLWILNRLFLAARPANQELIHFRCRAQAKVDPVVILRKIPGARGALGHLCAPTGGQFQMRAQPVAIALRALQFDRDPVVRSLGHVMQQACLARSDSPCRRRSCHRCRSPQSSLRAPRSSRRAPRRPAARRLRIRPRQGFGTAIAPAEPC